MSEKLAQLEKKGGGNGNALKTVGDMMAVYQIMAVGQGAPLALRSSQTNRACTKNTAELALAFTYSSDGSYRGWGLVGMTETSVQTTKTTSYGDSEYSTFNYNGKTIYLAYASYQIPLSPTPTVSALGVTMPYAGNFDDIKDILGLAITSLA